MSRKYIISIVLVIALAFSMSSTVAAATVGGAEDPLISKSYIDNTYPGIVLTEPLNSLANSIVVLKYKLSQASGNKASGAYTVSVAPDGSINLVAGSGFILVSGSSKLSSLTGTIIDLSDGTELSMGQSLSIGHRYLAAENTQATVKVVTASKIALMGKTTISGSIVPTFTDVTENSWYYSDVSYAVQKGLINGRSSTVYAPDENLSIAEAIKLAACMHQLYNTGSITLKNDSPTWYKTYVDYAQQNGIALKTYQSYDAKITRSEFVLIFYSALPSSEYTQKNSIAYNKIPDVKITDVNASQIYAFYRAGILTGSDANGTFYPNSNIKRSEVAAILTRMFEKDARKSITLS